MLHPCPCRSARRSPQPARLPDNLSPRRSFSQVKVSSTFLLSIRRKTIVRRPRFVFGMAVGALATAALADQEVPHPFETAAPLHGLRRIVIDIPAGELHIRNGANDGVAVHGAVRRSYDGYRRREENQRVVDDITAEVVTKGDQVVIRRRFGANATGWSARDRSELDVTIEVPSVVDLDVETHFGEVHLEGTFGNVDVDMNAGEIHMTTPRASVRELAASCRVGEVHANLGDKIVDREGLFPGTTHFTNPNGAKGDGRVHVTAGEVHVTLTT